MQECCRDLDRDDGEMKDIPSYFKYWGKAEKDGPAYHLLPYHCLDVAAVGWILLDPETHLCQRLAGQLGVTAAWLRQWFVFCLSQHDIGKFAAAFQSIAPNLSPLLIASNSQMPYTERHDTLGFVLWQEVLIGQWLKSNGLQDVAQPELARIRRAIDPWIEIVTGHHGEPPKRTPVHRPNFFTLADELAACHYFETTVTQFLADLDLSPLSDKTVRDRLRTSSWLLAGVVVLADWLGSGRDPHSYCQDVVALDEYWQACAIPFAKQVLTNADISHSAISSFEGCRCLFPFIRQLTPLQEWAETRQIGKNNQLFILEDVTGAGKTEAALALTHRLLAYGLADGLYVALPTMATANAMYERLGKAYRRLFGTDEHPSLVLAHGAQHLSGAFRESVGLPESSRAEREYSKDEEPNELYCSAWLADSRKKALLAEVGVGTLDQALLAILPARHQSLRIFGLAHKVLIVDEVHSYDPYMNQLLQTLIKAHAGQGGSVILLSATLPQEMREKYVRAFCEGTGAVEPALAENPPYPLATHFPTDKNAETHLEPRPEVERIVNVTMLDDQTQVLSIIKGAVEKGHCVCWVRNTVKDARDIYNILAQQEWLESGNLMLFHSRFAMMDRQRIEKKALKLFDKDSTAEIRRGKVLVATQVVEQSLDLDFDVMISDIAPIDLLIQRAGRLHRHVRDAYGNPLRTEGANDQRGGPHMHIFGPAPTKTPAVDWMKTVLPGTQAVYQHVGQLWLTQQILIPESDKESGKFAMPHDARSLIEGVYGATAQDMIPEGLRELGWEAEGAAAGQRGMARLNALKLEKGYTRSSAEDSGGWEKEARVRTRIEDDSLTVALARVDGDTLKPYADVADFGWEMSMINMPDYEWKKVREKIPGEFVPRIKTLKEEVKILKWVEVLPMTNEIARHYDRDGGWGLVEEEKK